MVARCFFLEAMNPRAFQRSVVKLEDPQWTEVPWQRTAPSASVLPWNASKKGAFSAAADGNGRSFQVMSPHIKNGVSRLGHVCWVVFVGCCCCV